MKVAVVSSSRADLSILGRLIEVLASEPQIDLTVIGTGAHVRDRHAFSATLPKSIKVKAIGDGLQTGTVGAARSMAAIMSESAATLNELSPDLVIVTGDRLDMAPVVFAAVPLNVPLLHLHGGEMTYGAVDDRLRHAITKLSHVHCVATEAAGERLRRMGEESWRVHVTGAPALDTLLRVPRLTVDQWLERTGLAPGFRLVTVHPETNSEAPLQAGQGVLAALDQLSPMPTLFTAPNSDPGGDDLRRLVSEYVASRSWAHFRDSLGAELYANAMRHASVMIGNSSSGLIEAGLFGLPVVNVGSRQEGRERGDHVADVRGVDSSAITLAVMTALGRHRAMEGSSPYGDGRAVERIVAIIKKLPSRQSLLWKVWNDGATCGGTLSPTLFAHV